MGNVNVKVSDLTGRMILDEAELATLRVVEHPSLKGQPVAFEVAHGEVKSLDKMALVVAVVELALPDQEPRRLVIEAGAFDKLATVHPMAELLESQGATITPRAARRPGPNDRIDYSSLEHAGRPHKGRTTEAEAAAVREHLAEVNERLAREGHRQIDPANPEHAARYGFSSATPQE